MLSEYTAWDFRVYAPVHLLRRDYRTNPNYLWNPNFCLGFFELIISKFLRQHPK